MGSVPNCRKEIPTRHAIRWFKCKLKPPNEWHHSECFFVSFAFKIVSLVVKQVFIQFQRVTLGNTDMKVEHLPF